MTTLAAPAPRKLPVWQTVGASYAAVARNLGQLLRISWLWFIIVAALYAALGWLEPGPEHEDESSILMDVIAAAAGVGAMIIEGLFLASIAVAWHQLILREERVTGPAYLRIDRTVWLYLISSLVLMFIASAPVVVFLAIAGLSEVAMKVVGGIAAALGLSLVGAVAAGLGSALLLLLVLPRLSLVLPAVALERRLSLRAAWRASRANTLRLALATVLCVLPAVLLLAGELGVRMRSWTDGEGLTDLPMGSSFAYTVLSPIAYAVLAIFGVTLLSLTYRFFVAPGDTGASPEP
jgi:hypothetical protein